jgi:hypothetical protein
LRDGFAKADRRILVIEPPTRKDPALRVILQYKRLAEQPFRKVKDGRCVFAASVFGTAIATPSTAPPVDSVAPASIRGEPMFFAKHSCHRWRAADFAFAFAHHF